MLLETSCSKVDVVYGPVSGSSDVQNLHEISKALWKLRCGYFNGN